MTMPTLLRTETTIRELHEDDTVVENRLVDATSEAHAARERIVADRRLDRRDLPDLLMLLDLVPAIHAGARTSRRYNLRINRLYCDLARERRQWALRPEAAAVGLERAP